MVPNCGAWGIVPDLPYPRNGRNYNLLIDTLKALPLAREQLVDARYLGNCYLMIFKVLLLELCLK